MMESHHPSTLLLRELRELRELRDAGGNPVACPIQLSGEAEPWGNPLGSLGVGAACLWTIGW